jgi:hypothetical protein
MLPQIHRHCSSLIATKQAGSPLETESLKLFFLRVLLLFLLLCQTRRGDQRREEIRGVENVISSKEE